MKILLPVHHFTDNPKSGLLTVIWNTAKYLAEGGHQVYVIAGIVVLSSESVSTLKSRGIHVYDIFHFQTHNLDKAEAFSIFCFSSLLRLFKKFDWIYVIDSSATPFSKFKLGSRLACRIISPVTDEASAIIQGPDWSYDRAHKDYEEGWEQRGVPFLYKIARLLATKIWFPIFPTRVGENADILFCQGRELEEFYHSHSQARVVYLPNGVESYRFDMDKAASSHAGYFYTFIGRIAKRKGILYLIEAFKKLANRHNDVYLNIIGRGSENMYREVEKLSGQLLKDGRITLLGEQDRESTVHIMQNSDVIVDPMLYAGFSTVVLEGLYCQKAVIAPRYGGTKDFIRDGENGFLVYSKNIEELFERMEFYYINKERGRDMAKCGYEYVKNNLTWSAVTDILIRNFQHIA